MKAPEIKAYPYTWESMERMVHELSGSGMTAIANIGYLLNDVFTANEREHVPDGRLQTVFELGWTEDITVERSESRSQHPLSKPREEIEQAHIRIMGGRTPFVPVQTHKAHALLASYGPLGDSSNSHRDHGLRVFDRDLWLEVIKPHYERRAQAICDDPRNAKIEALVQRQRAVATKVRSEAADPANGESAGLVGLARRVKAALIEGAKG